MIRQNHRVFFFLFAIAVLFTLTIPAQTTDISQTIDKYLTMRSEMGNFSGAVLIAKDGKIILRKGYGFADVERQIPYVPETKQNVASITKMFTAMAIVKLRDSGKLRFEDSICSYIDECPESWKPVTISNLLHHTSGIPDDEEMEIGSEKYVQLLKQKDPTGELINVAKKVPLGFQPGEKFSYSNVGYTILSRIVEKVARKPFSQFVSQTILKPAKLKSSGFPAVNSQPANLAEGYSYGDLGWDKVLGGSSLTDGHLRKLPAVPANRPLGAGGLYSTIDDLYQWSQLMDGASKLVPLKTVNEVFAPGLGDYGYGWFIDKAFNRKRFRHNGINPGFLTEFVKFPEDKVTIILFSNVDRVRMGVVIRDLSAIALGMPYDLPVRGKTIKLATEQIARLLGDYKMASGSIVNISQGETYLTAAVKDRYTAGLIPLSPTEFYFPLVDGKAIFSVDENGKAVKVNMRFQGEDHIAERVNQ